jgi:DNA polymerase-3 subunit epsilon
MRVLLVDVETSGISWDEGARVIEVAAALFDTKYAAVIESFSSLIRHHSNEAEPINGIPAVLLLEQGADPEQVWDRFLRLSVEAECFCAYNEAFDRGFVTRSLGTDAVIDHASIIENWDPDKPWVDAMSDIPWGVSGSKALTAVALGLGLGVASAHRAMVDVELMARCFARLHERLYLQHLEGSPQRHDGDFLGPIFRLGMRPKVRVVAKVSYDARQAAKDAGFQWDAERREWWRMMAKEDIEGLPFRAVEKA